MRAKDLIKSQRGEGAVGLGERNSVVEIMTLWTADVY